MFANHLNIALGSAAELGTQLEIALEVGYLETQVHQSLAAKLQEITKMLFGLRAVVTGKR